MTSPDQRQRQNVEAVSRGVEAYRIGDLEAVLEVLDEQIEVYMPGDLPNSGTYLGHTGYRQWLAQWLDAWDDFNVEIEQIEAVGRTHVVSRVYQTARGKGSGIPVEMRINYMWDIRDGRAIAMHLYATREQAVAEAERREREASD